MTTPPFHHRDEAVAPGQQLRLLYSPEAPAGSSGKDHARNTANHSDRVKGLFAGQQYQQPPAALFFFAAGFMTGLTVNASCPEAG